MLIQNNTLGIIVLNDLKSDDASNTQEGVTIGPGAITEIMDADAARSKDLQYFASQYTFTITPTTSKAVGETYTNNGATFTVMSATTAASTTLICAGTGEPEANGVLTYATGAVVGNITFASYVTMISLIIAADPDAIGAEFSYASTSDLSSAVNTHAAKTTGVHGVGGGTIAKVGDIAVNGNLSSAAQDVVTAGACDIDANLSSAAQAVVTAGACDVDANLSTAAQTAISTSVSNFLKGQATISAANGISGAITLTGFGTAYTVYATIVSGPALVTVAVPTQGSGTFTLTAAVDAAKTGGGVNCSSANCIVNWFAIKNNIASGQKTITAGTGISSAISIPGFGTTYTVQATIVSGPATVTVALPTQSANSFILTACTDAAGTGVSCAVTPCIVNWMAIEN